MMNFEQIITENPDIKYINDLIISTVSNEDSYIGIDFYQNHIIICAKIAYKLAVERDTNVKNAVIAALLHDFAMHNTKNNHEIVGSKYARQILNGLNFQKNDVDSICRAIEHHRDGKLKYKDKNDLVISDADAISYIINFSYFENYERKMNPEKADNILINKINTIYDIITPDGFNIIKNDYEKIKNGLEKNINSIIKLKNK